MANINLYKLLNGTPLYIDRWIQFVQVIQDLFQKFRLEKSIRLKNKVSIDTMDLLDVIDFIKSTGFHLPSFPGYTESEIYKRLRAKSIIDEVRKKYSVPSIKSIYKSFLVYGDVFQIQNSGENNYTTITTEFIIRGGENFLDQEADLVQYYVGGTPVPNPPPSTGMPAITLDMQPGDLPDAYSFFALDQDEFVAQTNHLLLRYKWILAESLTQLWSYNTAFAMYKTLLQNKKANVIYRYEPLIEIDLSSANILSYRQIPLYNDYTQLVQMKGILIGTDLSTVTKLKIGNGTHTTIDLLLTDLASPLQEYDIENGLRVLEQNATNILMETKYGEYTYLTDTGANQILTITEAGIFDISNNLIAYVTFPEINFYEKMYSSFALSINLI